MSFETCHLVSCNSQDLYLLQVHRLFVVDSLCYWSSLVPRTLGLLSAELGHNVLPNTDNSQVHGQFVIDDCLDGLFRNNTQNIPPPHQLVL